MKSVGEQAAYAISKSPYEVSPSSDDAGIAATSENQRKNEEALKALKIYSDDIKFAEDKRGHGFTGNTRLGAAYMKRGKLYEDHFGDPVKAAADYTSALGEGRFFRNKKMLPPPVRNDILLRRGRLCQDHLGEPEKALEDFTELQKSPLFRPDEATKKDIENRIAALTPEAVTSVNQATSNSPHTERLVRSSSDGRSLL